MVGGKFKRRVVRRMWRQKQQKWVIARTVHKLKPVIQQAIGFVAFPAFIIPVVFVHKAVEVHHMLVVGAPIVET